jgi:hypothetical protein
MRSSHNDEPAKSASVGTAIKQVLEQHGFEVKWDGDVGTRLNIPVFDWKRRLMDLSSD